MSAWRAALASAAFSGIACIALMQGCGFTGVGSLEPEVEGGASDRGPNGTDGATTSCATTATCDAAVSCNCVATPSDWTTVGIVAERAGDPAGSPPDAGAPPACPVGWASPRTLVQAPRSADTTCRCSCGAGPNPCTHGTFSAQFRTGSSSCNDGTGSVTADGACHTLGFTWNGSYNGAGGFAPAVVIAACPAIAERPAMIDDGSAVVCSVAGGAVPCAGGSCAPVAAAILKICALHDGDVACPAGYPAKRVLAPQESIVDDRACGACSCSTTATSCSNETLTFATNATCTTGTRTAAIDGTCNALSGSGTPTHYKYTAVPNQTTCAAAAATVPSTGAITAPSVTLCCSP